MKYRFTTTGTIEIEVVIEAESEERAEEILDENLTLEDYSNETVGVEIDDCGGDDDSDYEIEEVTVYAGNSYFSWELI